MTDKTKYQALIKKISTLQKDPSTDSFTPQEIALIAETLEDIQFLITICQKLSNSTSK